MGFFTEETQKTSVSLYIERLSNLEEIDWYLLQQLTESIQMQESGPREAVETVRKKLKHGGAQQKLRTLEILKLLMENSNQQFHRQFLANEKLKERFELILTSPSENPEVKKALVSLLGAWSVKYKNEQGMRAITELYELGRGKRRVQTRPRANTDTTRSGPPPPLLPVPVQSPTEIEDRRPTPPPASPPSPVVSKVEKRRSLPPPAKAKPVEQPKSKAVTKPRSHSTAASSSGTSGTRVFNFEKAKPRIIEEVAVANQNCNNLTNALKLINTSEERWEIDLQHDKRLQEYRDKCEESKKRIVRYTRLVENEEWIGTLLAANEDLLKALDMYDVMLVGEIPAAWLLAQQARENKISYYDHIQPASPTPKLLMRPPPPPPPPANKRLSMPVIEDSFSHMAVTKYEEPEDLDPFADPATPIEDENRRGYM